MSSLPPPTHQGAPSKPPRCPISVSGLNTNSDTQQTGRKGQTDGHKRLSGVCLQRSICSRVLTSHLLMEQTPTGRKKVWLCRQIIVATVAVCSFSSDPVLSAGRPSQHGFILSRLSQALTHSSPLQPPCSPPAASCSPPAASHPLCSPVLFCLEAHAPFCAMLISRPEPMLCPFQQL